MMCMLLAFTTVVAAFTVESPKACKQCGMDRTVFDQSRMLIVYADGTTVGVCSIHCAAADMKQNKDKQVKSLMVADYMTRELIDARTATWVVGGKKDGCYDICCKMGLCKRRGRPAIRAGKRGHRSVF